MTKIGNKGFMMAEVVVVSVIVAVTLVTLYTSTSRVTTAFNLRNRYHDLDCLNLSIAINDELIKSGDINRLLKQDSAVVSDKIGDLKELYDGYERINAYYIKNGYYLYYININSSLNKTAVSYLSNLSVNYNNQYNYYIVSEICTTEDNCFYYGLGVR